jgi:ATP-dependent helicase HrpB
VSGFSRTVIRTPLIDLPIDPYVPEILARVREARALVIVAAPGAGKTTRVPPALAVDGPLILLQPRRVAARAIASRIADERGWTLGREVGWQVRFERRFTSETQLLVATEGILTARLQQDPLLSSFRTVVLDEFHERSIHADVGLALAKQAWSARDDLRLVVMSATLDAAPISRFLGDCPLLEVSGRTFPIDVSYRAGQLAAEAAFEVASSTDGGVLCFLPGAFEIQRTVDDVRGRLPEVPVLALHGSLDPSEQDRALRAAPRRRIVVATNIAETSLTVPGIAAVVDSGLQKVARYDADRGVDSLVTERITQDAADQRAGRAGREGPGIVRRLWDARDRLRPHREPEIHRVDLSATALDLVAWGGDPRTFDWFETPPAAAIAAALELLARLGAVRAGALTDLGRRMQQLPVHPRLARILIAGEGRRVFAQACALLTERSFLPPRTASTTSDLLSAIDRWQTMPPHVARTAREIEQLARHTAEKNSGAGVEPSEHEFRRVLFSGYPDRVAQRRDAGSARIRLASGAGAVLSPESGVRGGEFLIAVDVHASTRPGDPDSRVRLASVVEREWLEPNVSEVVHRLEDDGTVRAFEIDRYDALILSERSRPVDPEVAAGILAAAYRERPMPDDDVRLIRRLAFAGIDLPLEALIQSAAQGVRRLGDIDLPGALPRDAAAAVARDAPEQIAVPSGRSVRLEYREDGTVAAAVKLQELFGLAETPRVGRRREPVLLSLLAPNGRPVQLTRDLRSFWDRTYPEVRKELRGRYPKHPWPDDPWNAVPTARTTRKTRS